MFRVDGPGQFVTRNDFVNAALAERGYVHVARLGSNSCRAFVKTLRSLC